MTSEKEARIPALLKMLAENGHETPFEKSALHFLVECDVATHIHLIKHRIAVSVNGESARYRELKARSHVPSDWPEPMRAMLAQHSETCERLYHAAIESLEASGMGRKRAKESARFFLAYTNVTTVDVQFNWRSFVHFLRLRNSEHAQVEIRQVAQSMLRLVREAGGFEESIKAFGL